MPYDLGTQQIIKIIRNRIGLIICVSTTNAEFVKLRRIGVKGIYFRSNK
jgi:hypothetical protein